MTRTYPTNSPIKPPQDFRKDDHSIDWRRRLEYHTGPVRAPPPPPAPAPPPPPPPSDSESALTEVEESRSKGDDTEVDIDVDSESEGKIISRSEPKQSAKHILPNSSNPNDGRPPSVEPGDHHPAAPHISPRSHSPVADWRLRIERDTSSAESPSSPPTSFAQTPVEVEDSRIEVRDTEVESDEVFEERFDKSEPEARTEDSLFGSSNPDSQEPQNLEPDNASVAEPESNANEAEPESNPDEEEPELNADEYEAEFHADTYEPENPEVYDLTEEDLAFFDQPYIPSRDQ